MLPSSAAWVVVGVTILSRSVLATMVAILLWGLLPSLVGFQTATVMSGSMLPRLQVGDAVVVRHVDAAQLSPGQVLLFDDPDEPGRLRLHRLVETLPDGRLVTKGDANAAVDPSTVSIDAVRGAGFLRIPFAGLPGYWYRTGQVLPLAGTGVLVVLLLAGVRLGRLLEDQEDRARRRHRGPRAPAARRAAAAGALLLVLSSGAVAAPSRADATYSSTTASTGSAWTSPCGELAPPAVGTTPRFLWSYGAGTGSAVADQSGNADPGLLAGGWSRATCAGGASPYVTVGSGSAGGVIETRSGWLPGDMTIATWFRTTSKGGVLADFGSSSTSATSGSIDRALYLRSDGDVTFAARTLSIVNLVSTPGTMTCTTTSAQPNGYADGAWHLVVATFGYTAGCTVTVDNGTAAGSSATQSPSVTLLLLAGYSGYWRFGYDAVTSPTWSGATAQQGFIGDLDETQAYDSILGATARGKIWARGR